MINSKIIKVSCCGANELLDINDVVNFLVENPQVEIGIGVSKEKCSIGMPRYNWILDLQKQLKNEKEISRIAFHINGVWSKKIVENGILPQELVYFLWNNYGLARIQLNLIGSGYNYNNVSVYPLANLITKQNQKRTSRFIIPVNEESLAFIKRLQKITDNFDVLYDSSFGFGKKAKNYFSYFPKQLQGYAGGLNGDNIQEELMKIDKAQKFQTEIWVDAEGKLKKNNINTLDLVKAKKFVDNALKMNEVETLYSDNIILK